MHLHEQDFAESNHVNFYQVFIGLNYLSATDEDFRIRMILKKLTV